MPEKDEPDIDGPDVIHIHVPSTKVLTPRKRKSLMPGMTMLDLTSEFVEVTISKAGDRVWIITKEHGTAFRVQLKPKGVLMLDDCRTGVATTRSPQHLLHSPLCPSCGAEMMTVLPGTWSCSDCVVGRARGTKDE